MENRSLWKIFLPTRPQLFQGKIKLQNWNKQHKRINFFLHKHTKLNYFLVLFPILFTTGCKCSQNFSRINDHHEENLMFRKIFIKIVLMPEYFLQVKMKSLARKLRVKIEDFSIYCEMVYLSILYELRKIHFKFINSIFQMSYNGTWMFGKSSAFRVFWLNF